MYKHYKEEKYSLGKVARILSSHGYIIGRNDFFKELRQSGYLSNRNGYNQPTQKSKKLGMFVVDQTFHPNRYGIKTAELTPRVTNRGLHYLLNKYCNNQLSLFEN